LAIPDEKFIRFAAIEFSMFFGIKRYDVIIQTTFSIYPVSVLTLKASDDVVQASSVPPDCLTKLNRQGSRHLLLCSFRSTTKDLTTTYCRRMRGPRMPPHHIRSGDDQYHGFTLRDESLPQCRCWVIVFALRGLRAFLLFEPLEHCVRSFASCAPILDTMLILFLLLCISSTWIAYMHGL
jgi:hypothetical protein